MCARVRECALVKQVHVYAKIFNVCAHLTNWEDSVRQNTSVLWQSYIKAFTMNVAKNSAPVNIQRDFSIDKFD
jgi:hypothetical protein